MDESELQQAAVDPALFDRRPRGGSEGTPSISEFLALEIGTAAGISANQAAQQIHQALDLKYRHPHLWAEVLDGRVRVWQALKVAAKVSASRLSLLNVSVVDEQFVQQTSGLPFNRAMKVLDGLIVEADPELAHERACKAAERRCVVFHPTRDGSTDLYAMLDAADAIRLKSTTLQLAQYLKDSGDTDPLELRQARALGLLATPARALAILQAHLDEPSRVPAQTVVYQACPDAPRPVRNVSDAEAHIDALIASLDPADDDATRERRGLRENGGLHAGLAHQSDPSDSVDDADMHSHCGRITIDPDNLLPKAQLIVHLSAETLRDDEGVARVEGIGAIDLHTMRVFLANSRVTVRPVVDLNDIRAVDRYEIPDRHRRAVTTRQPFEAFPYSVTPSRMCDLDHLHPWQPDGGGGGTDIENLVPLSRRVHRAKTAGHWILHQRDPENYMWESPLGFEYLVSPDGTRRLTPETRCPLD